MTILGGLDIHRAQLTYDYLDLATGEAHTGRVVPADRDRLRVWLERFQGVSDVAFALEGCTGWRYVVEELARAARDRPRRRAGSGPRPPRSGAGRVEPRPTGPTPAISARSSSTAACRTRGSRPPTCSTQAWW